MIISEFLGYITKISKRDEKKDRCLPIILRGKLQESVEAFLQPEVLCVNVNVNCLLISSDCHICRQTE